MRDYLERHFDFGATVVVFNTGATDPEFAERLHRAVWGEEALRVNPDFLGRVTSDN